ncbi:MAG: hypothetical protein ABID87_06715 [Chloroflexota bacterium]
MRQSFVRWCLIPVLAGLVLLSLSACEDFQQFPAPAPAPEAPAPAPKPPEKAAVNSADQAELAVYEHLLALAGSSAAKLYLADFYAASDNWNVALVRFTDGSTVWNVMVDMTAVSPWDYPEIWRQASWLVYRDGRIVPSREQEGNALRIEAELQELSLQSAAAGN